jgi:adenosylcobinamide-GDP ribazoletransferase
VFGEFLIAFQFLTVITVRKTLPFDEVAFGRSAAFFPLVGGIMGGIVWALDRILSPFVPPTLLSVVLTMMLAILSRGLHLDGLADSADGFFGGRDRQHCLDIMKDSRIGTFGALALTGVHALFLAPLLSRWALVRMAFHAHPARDEGLGALLVRNVHGRELLWASAFTVVVTTLVAGSAGFLLFIVILGVTVSVSGYCHHRLGGVTGDTLGAIGELVETIVLCWYVARL